MPIPAAAACPGELFLAQPQDHGGVTMAQLAAAYGVWQGTISDIIGRVT